MQASKVLILAFWGLVLFASSTWQAYSFWKDEDHLSAISVLMFGWGAGTLIFFFPVLVPIVWPTAQDSSVFRALVVIALLAVATGGIGLAAGFFKKLRGNFTRES